MDIIFQGFEEHHCESVLEQGELSKEGFDMFWTFLTNHTSLYELMKHDIIVYAVVISFIGTICLFASGIYKASSHNWDFWYVITCCGYLFHLGFEVVAIR